MLQLWEDGTLVEGVSSASEAVAGATCEEYNASSYQPHSRRTKGKQSSMQLKSMALRRLSASFEVQFLSKESLWMFYLTQGVHTHSFHLN